ncbi:MAG: hypothetical protein FWF10_02710 [Clostridiales bacterium]|nr:hypothetical protein [Clostridiales bacterium]
MNKKLKRLLCATLLLLLALTPLGARAANEPAAFKVEQVFSTTSTAAAAAFTYRLTARQADSPMPAGSTAAGYTFTITGTGSVQIGPFAIGEPGLYRYTLTQITETEKSGYSYDRRIYDIELHVDESREVQILAYNADGTKAEQIMFENSYTPLPSDPSLMPDTKVHKTVIGSPTTPAVFTFRLSARDAAHPMPPGGADGEKTIQITGMGNATFGTWSYTDAGTYYYTVVELDGDAGGYTYDTAVYLITDTVRDVDGQLVLTRIVTNSANKQVSDLSFINTFHKGDGPKTADSFDPTLAIVMLVAGGLLCFGAIIYLVASRRRRGDD